MLRIANPGSDISSFIRIYIELFEALQNRKTFGLDDMSQVLVERDLATSCGYMGKEALSRSTRKDRTRDPLYNQSKMYSELYKVLGWLHPLPESALTFSFTYLGAHIIEARRDPIALFKECILGIVYPNQLLQITGDYVLRPFATILKTIKELDGLICRDELIVGPLCLGNDKQKSEFLEMIRELRSIRGKKVNLKKKLNLIASQRKITETTMGNYTRFPLAVLKWTGWTISERRDDIYGQSIPFLILTEEGKKALQIVQASLDVRVEDLSGLDEKTKDAVTRIGFYQMLGRAGFDLEPLAKKLAQDHEKAASFLGKSNSILFSPFQSLEPGYVKRLFPDISGTSIESQPLILASDKETGHASITSRHLFRISLKERGTQKVVADKEIVDLFEGAFIKAKNIDQVVDLIFHSLANLNKDKFYPLVAGLFRALGYECQHSRLGVNYQRWDALIIDPMNSIPIEIKSPGEEKLISVKAVRQALENKIILLARKGFTTRPETTSLVVGYELPNDRSEVASLISDIYKAYKVVIGVIDIRSLLRLVAATILEGKTHDPHQLKNLHGIIDVSDT
jgi:hypothetical protein